MTARTCWTSLLVGFCILVLRVEPIAAQAAPAQAATAQAASSNLRTFTYPVADLVVPVTENRKSKVKTNEDALITLIKSIIAPTTWEGAGGTGRIQYFPASMSLVVSTQSEIQAEVHEMLKALRRLQDLQVCIEMQLIETSPEIATQWQRKSGMVDSKEKSSALISPVQFQSQLVEAQECKQTCVMQAPKLTMLNGQVGKVTTMSRFHYVSDFKMNRDGDETAFVPVKSSKDLGVCSELTPIVSSDRKSVRVKFRVESSYLVENKAKCVQFKQGARDQANWVFRGTVEAPVFGSKVADMEKVIPVGKTLLVSMGEARHVCREVNRVPMLGELPMVGDWFRSTRDVERTKHVFLTLTPRVLVVEETPVEILKSATAPIPHP